MLSTLEAIQKKVLWLSALLVHHANHVRPNRDGTKIGGHQASSSSVVGLMTALYFQALRPGDIVATKAHASPILYAIEYLRGRRYALPHDVRELAKDVLRHRMVLSYEALAEGVEADAVLDRVLEAVEMPVVDLARGAVA